MEKFRKAVPCLQTWARIETKRRAESKQNDKIVMTVCIEACARVVGGDGLSCRTLRQKAPVGGRWNTWIDESAILQWKRLCGVG